MEGGCLITLVRGANNDYLLTCWQQTRYDFQQPQTTTRPVAAEIDAWYY